MDCLTCITQDYYLSERHLIERETEEHYNDDPPYTLIIKFIGLFTFKHACDLPFHILYRIYDLLTGGFIHRGEALAKHKLFCQMKQDPSLRGRTISQSSLISESLKELTQSIGKLILLPLSFIAKQFLCVMGLFFCFHARKWYAKVEQFFYIPSKDLFEPDGLNHFCNFSAPCMQPISFTHEQNFFRYHSDYNPSSPQSLFFRLNKNLSRASLYLPISIDLTILTQIKPLLCPRAIPLLIEANNSICYAVENYQNGRPYTLINLQNLLTAIQQIHDQSTPPNGGARNSASGGNPQTVPPSRI